MDLRHFCQLNTKPLCTSYKLNPNCFDKIRTAIRQFTTISESYPLRKYYFRSTKALEDERIRHINGPNWFSIHPFSYCQYIRHYISCLLYLLTVFFDQIDITFLSKHHQFVPGFDSSILILNIIASVHVIVNFFTGYVSKTERINIHYHTGYFKTAETATVLDVKKISINYLKTFFIADIFAFINVIHFSSLIFKSKTAFYIYASLRHVRLIRFYTFEVNTQILLAHLRFQYNFQLVIRCIFWFTFLAVFIGGLLCYIPLITSYAFNEDRNNYVNNLIQMYRRGGNELTELKLFLHATYDGFCLVILYQAEPGEYTVELCIIITLAMIIGNVLKVVLFLTIFVIFNRKYQSRLKFVSFIKEVQNYVRNLNLSKQLCREVVNYFEVKLRKEYFNEAEIFNTLQRHMQYEIFAQSSMGLIRNCHLFRNLPNYFVVQLSLRLRCETYIPGVTVITVGEIATCMYFIATGTVAVYSADGTELCHLSDGEYVGEIGILQSTARVADIVTIEHCELYRLDIKDFQEVIKPNSKFYKRICKIAQKRMNAHFTTDPGK